MMEPWQSWAVFLAISGLCGGYYYLQNNAGRHRGRPVQRVHDTTARVQEHKKKGTKESSLKAAPKATKPKAQRKAKKPADENNEKSISHTSATSSTTGAEGDDDLSPQVSPTLGAIPAKVPSGRDVSDMLEPKATPAGVLRLTEPAQPVRQKQSHQSREATPQETKKQRQNKKKVEERKLQREQEEKERQVLLEKQRRSAREARGEPSKNGLQQAKAPASNAWDRSNGASETAMGNTTASNYAPLLDTFEQDSVSTTSSSLGATAGTSTKTEDPLVDNPWAGGMTEEEQIRLAIQDSEWTTVPKGRKAKKAKATSTEGSDGGFSSLEQSTAKTVVAPVAATPKVEYTTSAEAAALYASSHPMDSDWPVV